MAGVPSDAKWDQITEFLDSMRRLRDSADLAMWRTYAGAQFVAVAFDSSPRRPTRITRTGDTRRRRRALIPSSLCTTAGLQSAFQDVDAVIDYAQSLPFADASRITLVGMPRGGFLSIAYAAEGRERARVRSVINFVGGWVAQAEDQCPAL